MKVILQQDVKGTGKKGEVIEVSEGYGRNFLLPKKLAVLANAQNVNLAKQKAGSAAHRKAQEADEAKLLRGRKIVRLGFRQGRFGGPEKGARR